MQIPIRLIAIIIVCTFIGLALLPDFLFFPLIGVGMLVTGLVLLKVYPIVGAILAVGGVVMFAFGVKFSLDHRRRENEESDKAQEEVVRRLGRLREEAIDEDG